MSFESNEKESQSEPAMRPSPELETPLRRRARRRAQRVSRTNAGHLPPMPPLWVLLAAVVIPILFVISAFLLQRMQRQTTDLPSAPAPFVVTATLQPTSVLPIPFVAWLSTTPRPAPTSTPTSTGGLLSPFASATPGFTLQNSYIVFTCFADTSDEICVMRADGSDQRQLTRNPGTDWYPSFSPDGRTIVFSSQGSDSFDIYSMDINGENLTRLTNGHGDNFAPAFSPDGARIVFASTFGGGQNIWVMNRDGSNLVQLTRDIRDDIDPDWSPDGTQISYTSTNSGSGNLMIMNADGSHLHQVTHGINVEGRNDWSPDGRYLAFYAGPVGDKNIYLVDVACADIYGGCGPEQFRQLTRGGNNKGPGFSPDGQWITFASQLDGDNEIFIMRIEGIEAYQLTSNRRADWQPRWGWQP